MRSDRRTHARKSNPRIRKKKSKKLFFAEKQLELPICYKGTGTRTTTLREIIDKNLPTKMSCSELSRDQLIRLVTKRIQRQRKFRIAMIGVGILDKKRAIAAVKAQSRAGRILTEIERRVIDDQLDSVRKSRQTS